MPERFVKAIFLESEEDIKRVEEELSAGNIVIVNVSPLLEAGEVDRLRSVINELKEFVERIGGDIARLGDRRIVLTPPDIKVWKP